MLPPPPPPPFPLSVCRWVRWGIAYARRRPLAGFGIVVADAVVARLVSGLCVVPLPRCRDAALCVFGGERARAYIGDPYNVLSIRDTFLLVIMGMERNERVPSNVGAQHNYTGVCVGGVYVGTCVCFCGSCVCVRICDAANTRDSCAPILCEKHTRPYSIS